jgi:hypothetical protein
MGLAKLVVSIALGSLTVSLALYILEPPLGIALGVIICGLLVGILLGRPGLAFIAGLTSGLTGFLVAYGLGGGGSLGFNVYRELLGSIGPLVPLAYYMLSCGSVSALIAIIIPAFRRGDSVTLRK